MIVNEVSIDVLYGGTHRDTAGGRVWMPFDDQRRWTFTRARIRVPDRAALHEDDRGLPIPSHRRRRQADDEPRFGAFQDGFEGARPDVMTFVDDDLPLCFNDRIDGAMP